MKKLGYISGILFVFFLILATNLIDQTNFKKLQKSITSIYEDQLVVKNIIFDLSNLIHEKELANATSDSIFYTRSIKACDENIDSLIATYEETEMTRMEGKTFDKLCEGLDNLNRLEAIPLSESNSEIISERNVQLKSLNIHIHELAEIQVEEGFREKKVGNNALASIELFTQLEIYFLIFLLIVVSIIALSGRSKKKT